MNRDSFHEFQGRGETDTLGIWLVEDHGYGWLFRLAY